MTVVREIGRKYCVVCVRNSEEVTTPFAYCALLGMTRGNYYHGLVSVSVSLGPQVEV
jgi:hypothetical protein